MKIQIARISSTHGLKGDVKVSLIYLDMYDVFEKTEKFTIQDKEYKIKIKSKSKNYICSIEGVERIEDAEGFLGLFLEADIEQNENIPINGECLIDFDVYFQDELYGKVADWGNYGSGEVIEILNQKNNQIDIYLLDSDWIAEIDNKEKKIIMNRIY